MALSPYLHIVETAAYTAGTSVNLTVTSSNNVGDGDAFIFRCPVTIRDNVITTPVPVFVTINGSNIPIKNKFGQQILSDRTPKRAFGYYIADTASETPAPYVILVTTPPRGM